MAAVHHLEELLEKFTFKEIVDGLELIAAENVEKEKKQGNEFEAGQWESVEQQLCEVHNTL